MSATRGQEDIFPRFESVNLNISEAEVVMGNGAEMYLESDVVADLT